MNTYLPVDSRARVTLDKMLTPFTTSLQSTKTIRDIAQAINKHLPPGISYQVELRMRMNRGLTMNDSLKAKVNEIAQNIILMHVCENLPSVVEEDNHIYYYMREDIIRWYQQLGNGSDYFQVPEQETITISIKYGTASKQSTMKLSEDQIIGISYGLNSSVSDMTISLLSSITNDFINIGDITKHTLIYKLPITQATEELKRPYRIDVRESNGNFQTLHFVNPEFIQGIISVALWYKLPNDGKDVMWKNLFLLTREGLVELEF